MNKILYVHKNESIAYLIDRIESCESSDVYLNIDANLDLFSETTNLKLLNREADILGKNLIVVSEDASILSFAESIGFDISEMNEENKEEDFNKDENANSSLLGASPNGSVINDIKQPSFLQKNKEGKRYEEIDLSKESNDEDVNKLYHDEKNDEAESFFEKSIKGRSKRETPDILTKKRTLDDYSSSDKIEKGIDIVSIFNNKKITSIILGFIIILVAGSIFVFKPKATLDIIIKKETINFVFQAIADANISEVNLEENIIPGQLIKFEREVSGEFQATGESSGATNASGKITIYNEFGKEVQPLVAKTRFQTPDGKIFRITKRVVVPGAKVEGGKVVSPGILEVSVVADKPGSEYNLEPTDFKIPGFEGTKKFDGFYAKSSASMKGGSLGETKAITVMDLDGAKKNLINLIRDTEDADVKANVPKNLTILPNSVDVQFSELDAPKEGVAVDSFKATIKASYNVFAFNSKDLDSLSENILSQKVRDNKKTYPETKVISYDEGIFNLDRSTLSFAVNTSEVVGGKIDEGDLKSGLSGKGEEEIKKVLKANESIESAEVTLWPFWSSKAPSNPERIKIITQE